MKTVDVTFQVNGQEDRITVSIEQGPSENDILVTIDSGTEPINKRLEREDILAELVAIFASALGEQKD